MAVFDDIRPYTDAEVPAAIKRVCTNPVVHKLAAYLFPDRDTEAMLHSFRSMQSIREFQHRFSYHAVQSILDQTSQGFSSSGFEQLTPGKPHLFISNHRDIILDSAILSYSLVDHGMETVEIGTGDNLYLSDFITDLLRLNRSFMIRRPHHPRELLQVSGQLSTYIRDRLAQGNSLWIAQRNGRTKDGRDRTDTGLLKMLLMADQKASLQETLLSLRITPMAISYEYDPCDLYKARERYLQVHSGYEKHPKDDLKSMLAGVTDPKGRIHLALGKALKEEWQALDTQAPRNEQIRQAVQVLDRHILHLYKRWPVHYIAADMRRGTEVYSSHYSHKAYQRFQAYLTDRLTQLQPVTDMDALKRHLLDIYANVVES